MATNFTSNDQQVGHRFSGGARRGRMVQVEFSQSQWEAMDRSQSVSGDDGSHWDSMDAWMADMQEQATVEWMSRFVMGRRASNMSRTAQRWARGGEHQVAHMVMVEAQHMRSWRG